MTLQHRLLTIRIGISQIKKNGALKKLHFFGALLAVMGEAQKMKEAVQRQMGEAILKPNASFFGFTMKGRASQEDFAQPERRRRERPVRRGGGGGGGGRKSQNIARLVLAQKTPRQRSHHTLADKKESHLRSLFSDFGIGGGGDMTRQPRLLLRPMPPAPLKADGESSGILVGLSHALFSPFASS